MHYPPGVLQELSETDPKGVAIAVATVNHVYVNELVSSNDQRADDNVTKLNAIEPAQDTESTKEAMDSLDQLSDRLDKEEETQNTDNEAETSSNKANGSVVYANLLTEQSNGASAEDLIQFDGNSNGSGQSHQENTDTSKTVEEETEEEPNPDYDIKAVRFHTEVLDADENKLEPLRNKEEEQLENTEEDIDTSEKADSDNEQNTQADAFDKTTDAPASLINDESEKDNLDEEIPADGERAEEEINSPNFYFAEEVSTHF